MPALFDNGTDATTHRLSGRGRVEFVGQNRGRLFWQIRGQCDEHLGVLAYFGIHVDSSTVLTHYVTGYGKTESGAPVGGLRCEERVEDLVGDIWGNAVPVVFDADLNVSLRCVGY